MLEIKSHHSSTLLQTADAETMDMVRAMVGKKELALFIAKSIANEIGTAVNAKAVASILGITKDSAYNKISKVMVDSLGGAK
jgi:Trk K+ transport system NAD-binding subunit